MEKYEKRVAVYIRTEAKGDVEEVSEQLDRITEFIEWSDRFDYKVYAYHIEDGIPGDTPIEDRPQGSMLLREAKDGEFEEVLVAQISNLGTSFKLIQNVVSIFFKLNVILTPINESIIAEMDEFGCVFSLISGLVDFDLDEQRKKIQRH